MIPSCPNHGHLMNELVHGRLETEELQQAQAVRESCPDCADWWQSEIAKHVAIVDPAVEAVFASFQAPARHRLHGWLPVAAAAVLALAVGMFLKPVDPVVEGRGTQIEDPALISESFEIDTIETIDLSALSLTVVDNEPEIEAIFDGSQESGDLAGWSSHS